MSSDIEHRVNRIEERNVRVAEDKAWERSRTRRVVVSLFTYVVAVSWLILIGNEAPYLNAAVPVVGYVLSTLSLPLVRRVWSHHRTHVTGTCVS